jgi:hypothetical protein
VAYIPIPWVRKVDYREVLLPDEYGETVGRLLTWLLVRLVRQSKLDETTDQHIPGHLCLIEHRGKNREHIGRKIELELAA